MNIVLLGDSITAPSHDYSYQLRQRIDAQLWASGCRRATWINSGVPSAGMVYTTMGFVVFSQGTNYQSYVTDHKPAHVVSLVGINDAADPSWNQAGFVAGYQGFIDDCRSIVPGLTFTLVTPWLDGESKPDGSNPLDTQVDEAASGVVMVGLSRRCVVVDVRSPWFASTVTSGGGPGGGGYTTDGVHPKAPGPAFGGLGKEWLCDFVTPEVVLP